MTIGGTRRTTDGYLVADASIARTGIYEYAGFEVGKPDMPIVRVYRGEDTVFSDESMATFAHKPVTLGHPANDVSPGNWRDLARGYAGETVRRDGDVVRVPLMLTDAGAIEAVEGGTRELSAGYTADLVDAAGISPDGQAYDMEMRGPIRGNHIAIVKTGRAGSACRIGDSVWTPDNDGEQQMNTFLCDGLPVVLDAKTVETVIAARDAAIVDTRGERDAALADVAARDVTIVAKDAEIATLKAAVADAAVTPAKLQALATARAAVITDAKAIVATLDVTDAMTDGDIRKAVVDAKLGDVAKDYTPEQYAAAFAALPRTAPVADSLAQGITYTIVNDAGAEKAVNDARAEMLADLRGEKKES